MIGPDCLTVLTEFLRAPAAQAPWRRLGRLIPQDADAKDEERYQVSP